MSHASPAPQPAHHHTADLFSRTGIAASAQNAAQTRADFGDWLAQNLRLDETRVCDLLLATYEALANAAEYAYVQSSGEGTMDLIAEYEADLDQFVVTIKDHGVWRQPAPSTDDVAARLRGRGLPLMRELADEATISSTEVGTQVRLSWHQVTGSR
ncbi:MAG: ATP-binding protein [Mycobacterium sp.]